MGLRPSRGPNAATAAFSQLIATPESDHSAYLLRTLDRLARWYDESRVETVYGDTREVGEFDILVQDKGVYQYYEIKSTDNHYYRNNARNQFRTALNHYPERKWRFILVTPSEVHRYTPADLRRLEREGQQ